MPLSKLALADVDETSLTLSWDPVEIPAGQKLRIQHKLPQETWADCKTIEVEADQQQVKTEIADLVPGTPYFVRLVLLDDASNNVVTTGPETVFDTAPINCTPKKKSCIIQ